jgi:hypothetical protein
VHRGQITEGIVDPGEERSEVALSREEAGVAIAGFLFQEC